MFQNYMANIERKFKLNPELKREINHQIQAAQMDAVQAYQGDHWALVNGSIQDYKIA